MIVRVPTIPAALWERLKARVRRQRPIGSRTVRLRESADGVMPTVEPPVRRVHPWLMSAEWVPEQVADQETGELVRAGHWEISVRPGFLNGRDVLADGRPLTDDPAPRLRASWRNPQASAGLGTTAAGELLELPGEGFPAYFADLGARAAFQGSDKVDPVSEDRARTRELRACDVVLAAPRIGTAVSLSAQGEEVTLAVNALAASTGRRAFLRAQPKFQPVAEPTLSDLLLGGATVESQADELLIGTMWLLSPPETPVGSEPDETWEPIPQHFVWWNLARAVPAGTAAAAGSPLTFTLGLAVGVGDALITALLGQVNSANSAAAAFLRRANAGGQFWTH